MAKTLVGRCSAVVDGQVVKENLIMDQHPNNRFGVVAYQQIGSVEVMLKLNFMSELENLGKNKTDTATLSYRSNGVFTRHDISMRLLASGVSDDSTLNIEGEKAVDISCQISIE